VFGLFASPLFRDAQLGAFARSRGHWRGTIGLAAATSVPLILTGTRSAPDSQAVALAREVPARFASWRTQIEKALFEHYEPYAEALAAGESPQASEPFRRIAAPEQVWPYVSLVFVCVTPLVGILTTEFGYTTAWDEEHTLGARFQAGDFLELCGSVLPP
jgi:hypothetical protein